MASEPQLLFDAGRFKVVETSQIKPSGEPRSRKWIRHPGAVAIVPMLSPDRVCLIRNVRVAPGATLLEIPAGTLDHPEGPDATAHRELIEETGYRAKSMRKLCEFYTSPGITNELMHLYVATDLEPGSQDLEDGEEIETLDVPWSEAVQLALSGQIRDAKSLVGILLYEQMRQSGRA